MILYYGLIGVSVVIIAIAIKNFYSATKIEKNMDNYLFVVTSSKAYYIGATLFALALLVITAFQAMPYVFDIRVFSIVLFFGSIFLLSFSHYVYHTLASKKLNDYEEFFKQFGVDLNNKCEKLMLKYIYSKEKDLKKVKEVFEMNKEKCKEFKK
ncbi:adenylate kinase [Caminibacter pacificus]